jgi:hypothetical protein
LEDFCEMPWGLLLLEEEEVKSKEEEGEVKSKAA